MADGNEGMDSATPPSFIPSGSRKRSTRTTGEARRPQSDPSEPPSFSPAAAKRSQRAQGLSGETSHATFPASSASSSQPQSFAPVAPRSVRRSTGSSGNVARPAAPATELRPQGMPTHHRDVGHERHAARRGGAATNPGMNATANGTMPTTHGNAGGTRVRRRRHHPAHIMFGVLATLVVLLVLAVFGMWNWVDGNLDRTTWLTSKQDTSGATSWLLIGSDKRDGTAGVNGSDDSTIEGFRTDTILVLTKPKSGPSSLISIPRDSLVEVDGQYMKINSVDQAYGNKALVGEIEQITGQKIDHVAEIQFGGLKNVVDAIGGVKLCYDQDVSDAYSGLEWKSGCHQADGTTALAFSRMRYADPQGDFGRAARQRQVIAAVMKKAMGASTLANPAKLAKLASAALGSITVDENTNPYTLAAMALAFRSATGSNGVNGSVYWSDPDYYVDGVGSSVLLDDSANTELFSQLAAGTHKSGTVGTLAESAG
ncbi:LCP family protein [Bifidobacterium biavatii]|uniref:Transcriptional regulator n=1 Tax=Bifidobacterium biavatii DSM 23969 TaxID=1437608 RepID=A0A086ZUK5_9BIFI|nr:LCP family protein [Bifidobacterium biavatii]KFI50205.1 transcriptional regulator [Bifidobacterium biavatii DSM 23969]